MMEPLADTLSNALANAGMQISSIGEQKAQPARKLGFSPARLTPRRLNG